MVPILKKTDVTSRGKHRAYMAVSDIKGAIIRKTHSHFLLFFLNENAH